MALVTGKQAVVVPNAQKKRDGVLKWMDEFMDYGMIPDVPMVKPSCRRCRSPQISLTMKRQMLQHTTMNTLLNTETDVVSF